MVALRTPDMVLVYLKNITGKVRKIDIDSQLIKCTEPVKINPGREKYRD